MIIVVKCLIVIVLWVIVVVIALFKSINVEINWIVELLRRVYFRDLALIWIVTLIVKLNLNLISWFGLIVILSSILLISPHLSMTLVKPMPQNTIYLASATILSSHTDLSLSKPATT